MKRWVMRIGSRVMLTPEHKDDGLYELLRRIEELETNLEIERMKSRNLENMLEEATKENNNQGDVDYALLQGHA